MSRYIGTSIALAVAACAGHSPTPMPAEPAPVRAAPEAGATSEAPRDDVVDDDGPREGPAVRRARWVAQLEGAASCLPDLLRPGPPAASEDGSVLTELDLDLTMIAGKPVLCAVEPDDFGARPRGLPLACWDLDPVRATLASRPQARPPGRGTTVALTRGCAEGFCLGPGYPDAELDGSPYVLATRSDGARAVLSASRRGTDLFVFDTASRRILQRIRRPDDPDEAIMRLAYVADTIYQSSSNVEIDETAVAFSDRGEVLGPVGGARKVYLDGGGISVLDEHTVAFADYGLQNLLVVDARTGRSRSIRRVVPRSPCTREEVDALGSVPLEELSPACARSAAELYVPYVEARLVLLPGGDYLAALTGAHAGELRLLDSQRLVEKRRWTLPSCPP